MQRDIDFLKKAVIPQAEHSQLMNAMSSHETRIDALEDFRTRVIAYLTMAGTVGGIVASFIVDMIKKQVIK